MIKLLFNDKRIFLVNDYTQFIETSAINNAYIIFNLSESKLMNAIDSLLISTLQNIIVVGDSTKNLNLIKNYLKVQIAGGGVVKNSSNELLFIFRRKKWDLPKGKLEENETIEMCALREVKEETGISDLNLHDFLDISYHIYMDNEYILKETHWYLMQSEDRLFYPQKEEGIKKVVWIHVNNIQFQLNNTYESIKDIVHKAVDIQA